MRILTFNTMTAGKDLFPSKGGWWFTRTIKTIKKIKEINPDVFCLQEVTPLQMTVFMFINGYRCKGKLTQNPVFYRKNYQVLHSESKLMKNMSDYLRSYTYVILDNNEKQFGVVSTHIDWDETTRELQKKQVYDAIKQQMTSIFVCGDFNKENDTFFNFTATKPSEGTYKDSKIDYIFNTLMIENCEVIKTPELSDHNMLILTV